MHLAEVIAVCHSHNGYRENSFAYSYSFGWNKILKFNGKSHNNGWMEYKLYKNRF